MYKLIFTLQPIPRLITVPLFVQANDKYELFVNYPKVHILGGVRQQAVNQAGRAGRQ